MRVAIADDSPYFRDGLAMHLEGAGVRVTHLAATGDELLRAVEAEPPDVAILDIAMPPGRDGGLAAAELLRHDFPDVGVLLLSVHDEAELAVRVLAPHPRGVGYLLKNNVTDIGALLSALQRIKSGDAVLAPETVGRLANIKREPPSRCALATLSERETEVLTLIAEGFSNAGIACRLHVSESTVANHFHHLCAKLGLCANMTHDRRVLAVLRYLQAIAGARP
jgi:DNA-binding NarL/FixJ family response regulator